MMIEVRQFRDPARDNVQLAELMQQARAGLSSASPVPEWLPGQETAGPSLVYDTGLIERRAQWLGELSESLSITPLVAVKSCPDPSYLEIGKRHLGGFDVSNLAEYACLPGNIEGKLVSITGPDLDTRLDAFTDRGNTAIIVLDSPIQLDHYFAQRTSIPYLLRIQGSDLLKNGDPPDPAFYPSTRFGFTFDEAVALLREPRIQSNPPAGFHVHHGSETNRATTYKTLIDGLKRLAGQLESPPRHVNLGGGWHSLQREEIPGVLRYARDAFPLPCSILLEPGRWYAENAGFAVGTIVNMSRAGNAISYTLNLSARCHLHWSDARLLCPVDPGSGRACEARFFGASCYEADRIGRFLLPFRVDFSRETGLAPGNRVIFSGISTYSAAWNTSFNGIPRAEVIWYGA